MKALRRSLGDAFGFLGRLFKAFFNVLWGFMVIFSFIVNIVLVVVLVVLGLLIFNIKNDVADPLLKGLHSSFVGLDEATIDWTIPVRDSVDAKFTLPLEQNTVVVLTADVPLTVSADISGPVSINNATVALTLPEGLPLPVSLDLDVPVDEQIPVELDVRAVIPLNQTQLHDPFENLRLTFEPIIRVLDNLPNDFNEASVFGVQLLNGTLPDLYAPGEYAENPWLGFSRTAGLGYDLLGENQRLNVPGESPEALFTGQSDSSGNIVIPNVVNTGIVPPGGIPALDEGVRPGLDPDAANQEALSTLEALEVPAGAYEGGIDDLPSEPASTPPPSMASQGGTDGAAVGGPVGPDGALIAGTPQPVFTVVPGN